MIQRSPIVVLGAALLIAVSLRSAPWAHTLRRDGQMNDRLAAMGSTGKDILDRYRQRR